MITVALLSILISLMVWGLLSMNKRYQLFKELGIKHFKPIMFFGNTFETVIGRKHQCESVDELYQAYPDEEILGYYQFGKPMMVVRTPELVNQIFVQSFSNFTERFTSPTDGKIRSPFDANLFSMNGNTWRIARNRFSPLFTSGKLKFMYNSMADCGKNLANVLDKKDGQEMDISDVMLLFSLDVIGSTVFGLDAKTLENPNTEFREKGKKIFEGSLLGNLRTTMITLFPKAARKVGIKAFSSESVSNYFIDILRQTMETRKERGMERNDFVQMLLQLKEKGKVEIQVQDSGDDYLKIEENPNNTFELEMSDDLLLGGAFTFFAAGYHATAMTLAYALYELARHPEATAKLRAEIGATVKGEEPTYDELKDMPYLEKVVKETLRLYPTAPVLTRNCTKEFKTPGGVVIKPGQAMFIPVYSIQRDPAYWSDPEEFNPDRFNLDCPPKPGTYLAFGDGPRICIAMRFAVMEIKYALVKLMKNYNFELTKKMQVPLKMHPRIFLMTPADGITFRVTKAK